MVSIGSYVRHEETGLAGEVVDVNPDEMKAQIEPDGAADGSPWFSVSELEEL